MNISNVYKLIFMFFILFVQTGFSADSVSVLVPIDEIEDQITVFTGDNPGDSFAAMITAIGDINGDGIEDFAFFGSAGKVTDEESIEDKAYIFYGQKQLPRSIDLSQSSSWGICLHSLPGMRNPMPKAGLGDINRDGFDDIIFGPCAEVLGDSCSGYILFGGPDLTESIDTNTFEGCNGCEVHLDSSVLYYDGVKDFYGYATGDFNNDGIQDLVISVANSYLEEYPEKSGIVYLIFGSDSFPESIDLTQVGKEIPGCKISSSHLNFDAESGGKLGFKVCAKQDFNLDGISDLIVSAPTWDRYDGEGWEYAGAVFVLFGRNEWPSFLDLDLEEDRAEGVCFILSSILGSRLGQKVLEGIRDVTGDGRPDLLVSGGPNTYLISGQDIITGKYNIEEIKLTLFIGDGHSEFSGAQIYDWNEDGIGDFCFRNFFSDSPIDGARRAGAIYLLYGGFVYPDMFFIDAYPEYFDKIIGTTEHASFGRRTIVADVNGDGKKDLVVTAPGPLWGPSEEDPPGKMYIIPNGTELLGPLVCSGFAPGSSILEGGTRIYVTGKGFDEKTRLYIGEKEAEIIERPHSRTLIARIPEVNEPGTFSVHVERGQEKCTFEEQFVYYDSIFPREINALELGDKGCTIFEPNFEELPYILNTSSWNFRGSGGDFTGDGLADILIAYDNYESSIYKKERCVVYLLHGAKDLPEEVLLSENITEWATIFNTNETGDEYFGYSTILAGDMNGDGKSELLVSAPVSHRVYLILGGEIPKGSVNIHDDLMDNGRCVVIEDCPYSVGREICWVNKLGDINGDGLSDVGIIVNHGIDEDGNVRSCIAFLLGCEEYPESISFNDLPKMYGKQHSNASRLLSFEELGDVNGDGFDDFTFTVSTLGPAEPGGDPKFTGRAVFFGRSSFDQVTTYEEELSSGGVGILVDNKSDWSCYFGKVGDQNGDGFADIGLSTVLRSPEVQPSTGKFRIIYGCKKSELCKKRDISKDHDFDVTFPYSSGYNGMIWFISGGKDFNNDNKPDILLSDWHGISPPPPGRAITMFGGDLEEKAGPLGNLVDIFEIVNYESEERLGRRFPSLFEFAGDVNGDGYEDLLFYDMNRAYIYFNPLGKLESYFVRGDANQDGNTNIADVITILEYLFGGRLTLPCFDSADLNDDEKINLADPIFLLSRLFASGDSIPPPVECGPDPGESESGLGCVESICK